MSTTPRPWKMGLPRPGYSQVVTDSVVIGSTWEPDDADLIVTAVNEHDALVAKVAAYEAAIEGVRSALDPPIDWESNPSVGADYEEGLDDGGAIKSERIRRVLDAALGDQS